MLKKAALAFVCVLSLAAVSAEAAVLRVVVVQTQDAAAYVKAIEQGRALLKAKGSPIVLRVWQARYAGENAGAIAVGAEFPSLEALAKDDAMMSSDPELRAWLASLDKLRKIVSDSIYTELK
jgi:hypothetical protein